MMSKAVQAWHCRINYMIRWKLGLHTDIHRIGKIKACVGFRWYLQLDGFTSSWNTVTLYWIIGLCLAFSLSGLSVHLSISELDSSQFLVRWELMASSLNNKDLKESERFNKNTMICLYILICTVNINMAQHVNNFWSYLIFLFCRFSKIQ